jgi:hypothetical protein
MSGGKMLKKTFPILFLFLASVLFAKEEKQRFVVENGKVAIYETIETKTTEYSLPPKGVPVDSVSVSILQKGIGEYVKKGKKTERVEFQFPFKLWWIKNTSNDTTFTYQNRVWSEPVIKTHPTLKVVGKKFSLVGLAGVAFLIIILNTVLNYFLHPKRLFKKEQKKELFVFFFSLLFPALIGFLFGITWHPIWIFGFIIFFFLFLCLRIISSDGLLAFIRFLLFIYWAILLFMFIFSEGDLETILWYELFIFICCVLSLGLRLAMDKFIKKSSKRPAN